MRSGSRSLRGERCSREDARTRAWLQGTLRELEFAESWSAAISARARLCIDHRVARKLLERLVGICCSGGHARDKIYALDRHVPQHAVGRGTDLGHAPT